MPDEANKQKMEYRPVWQTWNLIHEQPCRPHCTTTELKQQHQTMTERAFRENVQKFRIERRMTVADFARYIECDVEVFAAYERGDEILSSTIMDRLRKVFQ